MAISFELTGGIRRKVEFGPTAVLFKGKWYPYDQMAVLPHVVRRWAAFSGRGMEFAMRDGHVLSGYISRFDEQRVEQTAQAIERYLNTGQAPIALQGAELATPRMRSRQATADKRARPGRQPGQKVPLEQRLTNAGINPEGCLKVTIGFAVWIGMALLIGFSVQGEVYHPILYGFFISTVVVVLFMCRGLLAIIGLFGMVNDHRRRRR